MSTPLTLTVGGIELTYNTMHMGMDHGILFQERDRKRRGHSDLSGGHAQQCHDGSVSQREMCFCRTLGSMLPRLELLGCTLAAVKAEYEWHRASKAQKDDDHEVDATPVPREPLTFEQFVEFTRRHPVLELKKAYEEERDAKGQGPFARDQQVALRPEGDTFLDRDGYSERSHYDALLEFEDPYLKLRLLAENPENLALEVVWDYGNFVDAGWAKNEDFVPGARRKQTYLIATEGSSDTYILKRSFAVLRPDVEDFFRFIDVEKGHPFSGTGNLSKFAEGLVKIDVHNRVVCLFDNDAEGIGASRSLERFNLPVNMRSMVLPDIDALRNFSTRGPGGISGADINGSAAAIECYLDLRLKDRPIPCVTWTNFKESLGIYQGALDFKDTYTKAFLATREGDFASGAYDTSKLKIVLDALLRECSEMATEMHLKARNYRDFDALM